jgi:hypothetical protein
MADYRIKLSDFFLTLTGKMYNQVKDEEIIKYILVNAPRIVPDDYFPDFTLDAANKIKEGETDE